MVQLQEPLVLGAFGRQEDSSLLRSFFGAVPGCEVLHSTASFEVRSVGSVEGDSNRGFHWGAAVCTEVHPQDWRAAAEDSGAAGLFPLRSEWVLFTDALGTNPLYFRKMPNMVFFATRLAPLQSLGHQAGSLSIDWSAWSAIMVIGSPLGAATPFSEIRRIRGNEGLAVDALGAVRSVSFTPRWLGVAAQEPSPDGIVESVRAALPARSWRHRPPAITLSGGWDSRLLAGVARTAYSRRPKAWTTGQDDGRDLDLEFAPSVARVLRLPHKVVPQPESGWPEIADETRRRVQFETWLHQWLTPLARRLRNAEREVLDGLAGDVLIKGLFVDDEVLAAATSDRLDKLFQRLAGRLERFSGRLDRAVGANFISSCRTSFVETAERFHGHMNQLALTVLYTRTTRMVALSPKALFAPEVKPWLPFLHPDVLSQCLAADPASKTDGSLYRRVLTAGAMEVSELPSTNDVSLVLPHRGPRLQESAEALAWTIELILASPVASSLLDPRFRSELRTEGAASRPDYHSLRLLQALSLLAQWEREHEGQVVIEDPG